MYAAVIVAVATAAFAAVAAVAATSFHQPRNVDHMSKFNRIERDFEILNVAS